MNLKQRINHINSCIEKVFTQGQIKKLTNPEKLVHWSASDIAAAISFRSASPKGYKYMRLRCHNHPLPGTLYSYEIYLE